MKNKRLLSIAVLLVFSVSNKSFADEIMLLGDGNSQAQIGAYLQSQGHNVYQAGDYYDWDGSDSTIGVYDKIFLLYGYDYGDELTAGGNQNLVDYVGAGGTLVTTEWLLYSIDRGYFTGTVADLLPVTYGGDYDYDPVWNFDESNPYMAGLTNGWSDTSGYSEADLVAGAVSVADDGLGNSLLSYIDHAGGGRVIHLNHDLTYETDPMSSEALTLIGNLAGGSAIPEPGSISILVLASIGLMMRRGKRKRS